VSNKLYVVTRNDLTKSQQAVQSGHALAEFLLTHNTNWTNGTLVYLKVVNEVSLKDLTKELNNSNIAYVSFKEPDRGDELTAIASLGNNSTFKSLQLL
jgi:hypothetical protein